MRTQNFVQILLAATLFAGASAQAAKPTNEQLARVVITGKASRTEPVQLPRVVVTGLSVNSQLKQLMLAAACPSTKRI